MTKPSEIFEGPNSSLRKTFDNAAQTKSEEPVGIEPEKDTKSGVSEMVERAVSRIKYHPDTTFVTEKMRVKMGEVAIEHMFEAIEESLTTLATDIYTELEEKQPAYPVYETQDYTQGFVDCQEFWWDTLIAEKKKLLRDKE